jgi:hypothetical protein
LSGTPGFSPGKKIISTLLRMSEILRISDDIDLTSIHWFRWQFVSRKCWNRTLPSLPLKRGSGVLPGKNEILHCCTWDFAHLWWHKVVFNLLLSRAKKFEALPTLPSPWAGLWGPTRKKFISTLLYVRFCAFRTT